MMQRCVLAEHILTPDVVLDLKKRHKRSSFALAMAVSDKLGELGIANSFVTIKSQGDGSDGTVRIWNIDKHAFETPKRHSFVFASGKIFDLVQMDVILDAHCFIQSMLKLNPDFVVDQELSGTFDTDSGERRKFSMEDLNLRKMAY